MRKPVATRVLIVEDEPSDALAVRRTLLRPVEDQGSFEVRHAGTLAEGIERLKQEPADVLLLDLGLPDSDGVDTVVRVRLRAPNLPLVVLTGSDDVRLAARTLEAGADGHLVKGELGPRLLRRVLIQAIERRTAGHESPPPEAVAQPEEHRLLHELRKLNALVLGNAEILRDEVAQQPRLATRMDALVRAARASAAMTERLFARIGASERAPEFADVSALVRRAEPLLRALMPPRIRLSFDLAEDLTPVSARVEQLSGALLELVSNAVDAIGDSDGVLELRTGAGRGVTSGTAGLVAPHGFEQGPHVWLEVRDTGQGFDAAALFRQLPAPAAATDGGYGSSQLERLLAAGEAALFVDSRPGAGATFRLLLRSRAR